MHPTCLILCFAELLILSGCSSGSIRQRNARQRDDAAIGELRAQSARQEDSLLKTQEMLQALKEEGVRLSLENKALSDELSSLRQSEHQEGRRIDDLEAQLAALKGKLSLLERKSEEGNAAKTAEETKGSLKEAVGKNGAGREVAPPAETGAPRGNAGESRNGPHSAEAHVRVEESPTVTPRESTAQAANDPLKERKSLPGKVLGLANGSLSKVFKGDGGWSLSEIAFLGGMTGAIAAISWFAFRWLSRRGRGSVESAPPPAPVKKVPVEPVKKPITGTARKPARASVEARTSPPEPRPPQEEESGSTQVISGAPSGESASTQIISRQSNELDPDQALLAELEDLMGQKFGTK